MEPTNETPPCEEQTGAKEQFSDALRHVWWAGLGLLSVTGQEGEKLFKTLVDKGREMEPSVYEQSRKAKDDLNTMMGDMGQKLKGVAEAIGRGAGKAEVLVDEKVTAALQRMGFPNKEEIQELSRKIDELKARLEEMQRAKEPEGTPPQS